MNMNDPLLEIRNLSVGFHGNGVPTPVLHNVDLDLKRGKVLVLLGESGCGKSLIGSAILGLLPEPARVSAGAILLRPATGNAVDLLRLPAQGREIRRIRRELIGMIFQEPQSALSPVHTVGDQMCEAVMLHQPMKRKQAEILAGDMLAQVGLHQPIRCMNQFPHELSGGMRQRVVIAMALVRKPSILIADEPTTALDILSRDRVLHLIKRMKHELDMAVLFITHDVDVARQVADDIAVIYCGKVVERGSAQHILDAPKHPYTKGLLESTVRAGPLKKHARIPFIGGALPSPGALPDGCFFHPRCRDAVIGTCDQAQPLLARPAPTGQEVACLRIGEFNDRR